MTKKRIKIIFLFQIFQFNFFDYKDQDVVRLMMGNVGKHIKEVVLEYDHSMLAEFSALGRVEIEKIKIDINNLSEKEAYVLLMIHQN